MSKKLRNIKINQRHYCNKLTYRQQKVSAVEWMINRFQPFMHSVGLRKENQSIQYKKQSFEVSKADNLTNDKDHT